jgi:hypothetical protein
MILFVDDYHFVAALPGPAGDVVLVDPPTEPERVAWSALAKRWHGEAIVIGLHDEDVASALRR